MDEGDKYRTKEEELVRESRRQWTRMAEKFRAMTADKPPSFWRTPYGNSLRELLDTLEEFTDKCGGKH